MEIFGKEDGPSIATYLVDNYGVTAADSYFDWVNNGSDTESAARDIIKRFGRLQTRSIKNQIEEIQDGR